MESVLRCLVLSVVIAFAGCKSKTDDSEKMGQQQGPDEVASLITDADRASFAAICPSDLPNLTDVYHHMDGRLMGECSKTTTESNGDRRFSYSAYFANGSQPTFEVDASSGVEAPRRESYISYADGTCEFTTRYIFATQADRAKVDAGQFSSYIRFNGIGPTGLAELEIGNDRHPGPCYR